MKETDLFVVQRPTGVDSGTYKVAASDIPANAVVSATAPTDPMDGGLWFDSNSDTLKTWNGTAWVESSSGGGGGVTSITAGTGISVDKATGDVTITNTGGGGGGGGVNSTGATAWGSVGANGATAGIMNATITKTGLGSYTVSFITPMPSADYAVTLGSSQQNVDSVSCGNKTVNGFNVTVFANVANASLMDGNFNFAVFALNALPPKGGTGTDAWGSTSDAAGTISASFNIESISQTVKPDGTTVAQSDGIYYVKFSSPMPTSNYCVTGSAGSLDLGDLNTLSTGNAIFHAVDQTTQGFTASCGFVLYTDGAYTPLSTPFTFTVNATNATLPLSFSSEQIEAAINNPGCSAWAQVAENGNVAGSLNISDVNRTGAGKYQYTFATPMPNANYSVIGSVSGLFSTNGVLSVGGITANGFLVTIKQISDSTNTDKDHAVAVFATNALPPKGGTGADAWGEVLEDASVPSGFNIKDVTKLGQGVYQVNFNTPMPSTNYAVTVTGGFAPNVVGNTSNVSAKTVNSFKVDIVANTGAAIDQQFDFVVHATNAQLPDTVTQEQIESAINNPGASAWGYISGASGGLTGGLNISSVTRTGTGQYDVVFATPMPSAVYSVVTGVSPNSNRNVQVWNQTATGFTTRVDTPSDSSDINFVVFATNALPPKGGTGTDAWANVSADGTILSSFNATVVKAAGNGDYDITFVNPMPTADYAVTATVSGDPAIAYGYSCITNNKTSAGFRVSIVGDNSGTFTDNDFSFTVNATNATLPSTFTVAQFNDLVARVTALENP